MKLKLSILLIITISFFSSCSNKSSVSKEKIDKIFEKVQLETKKEDAIIFINNKKDINKINNLYQDTKNILNNNKFYINYECTFLDKTKKKAYSYFNKTYTTINGDYYLDKCIKKETPLLFESSRITIENKRILFDKISDDKEKLNTYVNFLMFLFETEITENQTILSKYNMAIPFSLNLSSFKEDNLTLDDEFLSKISVKRELEKMLIKNNYQITDEILKANIRINVENLVFANNLTTNEEYKDLIIISKKHSSMGMFLGRIGVDSGNLIFASIGATFYLANVLHNIGQDKAVDKILYTINKCEIVEKDKKYNTYMNTYKGKNYKSNTLNNNTIRYINELVSSNMVEYRIKHKKED